MTRGLGDTSGHLERTADRGHPRDDVVGAVAAMLRQRIADPISLPDMADLAGFSPAYFSHMFGVVTGIPPMRFLTALRLEAAKQLLVDTDLPVTEICFAVGYRSLGTFSSRFTGLVGVSPNGFRRLAKLDSWPRLAKLLAAARRSVHPVYLSHKQTAVGTVDSPGLTLQDAESGGSGKLSTGPVFIGTFAQPIPQGAPVAYTVVYESPIYTLPRVPDGRYYVLATSFAWSEDPRSHLLPRLGRGDVRVGRGDHPLWVFNGRIRNHVHLRLRRPRITDPPLLSSLPHLMLRSSRKEVIHA
jgi:AraC family transcriptional regulator